MLKQNHKFITKDDVFSQITDEDVFNVYFGDFDFSTAYNSVFRKDDKPSTGFYRSDAGKIYYNDLTTEDKYDSISFVMKLYNLSFSEALCKIKNDVVDHKEEVIKLRPIKRDEEKYKYIGIIPRKFTTQDLIYWDSYYIMEYELTKNKVYSVDCLLVNGKFIYTKENELKFAYIINCNDKEYVKIYAPYNATHKAWGNVPLRVPFNYDKIDKKGDVLIITKSMKDLMIWRKYYKNVIALQNESIGSFDDELLLDICNGYNKVYLNFDSDAPGKKAASKYVEKYGFPLLTIPEKIYQKHKVKDVSDFVQKFGMNKFKKLIKLWQM